MPFPLLIIRYFTHFILTFMDEIFHHMKRFIISKLLRRVFAEISRRRRQHSTFTSVERQLGTSDRIYGNSGGVGRILDGKP